MSGRKISKYMGYLGFTGFLGFQYFINHDPIFLSYFGSFGFFAYFWISKISREMLDERYVENSKVAKAFTLDIAVFEFAILYLSTLTSGITKEILLIIIPLCFSSLIIIYAMKFYKLEKL